MRLYGVIGRPILHSKSPKIFRFIFRNWGINGNYVAFIVDSVEEAISFGKKIGFSGLNVTSPYKEEILRHVDLMDDRVKKLRAANTIIFSGETTFAFNTDVDGIREAFSKNGVELKGKKVAIIGAGGSAKAVAFFVSSHTSFFIFNRSDKNAKNIITIFGGSYICPQDKERLKEMDVLIFCLPAYLDFEFGDFIREGQVFFDANYVRTKERKKVLEERGIKYIGGEDWFLFQAIYSARHFLGIEIAYEALKDVLYGSEKKSKIICLIGFMGSGKTEVGRSLAEKLGFEFLDTDEVIEAKERITIDRIFKEKGEGYFREIEEKIITELLNTKKEAVISLGGGSILSAKVREALKEKAVTVWLWAEKETILNRTFGSKSRPLLKYERIDELLKERMPFYKETADIIVSTENRVVDEIANRLKEEIDYGFHCD